MRGLTPEKASKEFCIGPENVGEWRPDLGRYGGSHNAALKQMFPYTFGWKRYCNQCPMAWRWLINFKPFKLGDSVKVILEPTHGYCGLAGTGEGEPR